MGKQTLKRHSIGSAIQQLKHRFHPANRYPDLMGALSDSFPRPRYLLRLEAIPFLVGDYPTALRASARRARRREPQSLFVSLVSEWSIDVARAEARAASLLAEGGDQTLAALTRFNLYLERPEQAQETLDAVHDPEPRLMVKVASIWRRHGFPERAEQVLAEVLAADPANSSAKRMLREVEGERTAVEWSWVPADTSPDGSYVAEPDRVLHMVSRSLPQHHAGSTYRTHYTIAAQRRAGIDSHIVTECGFPESLVSSNGSRPSEIHEDVAYHRLPGLWNDAQLDRRFTHHLEQASELVDELRPAVLHPHSDFRNAAVALALKERFGIPVVYEVRGFPEEYLPRRPASQMLYERFGTRRKIEAECWRRADRVVTLAEVMKEHIVSKGADPDRVIVIPNAVDAERFRPAPRDERLAAGLGIEPGETVLGYVSSLTAPYEGIRYLIEAVVLLTRKGRPAKALIVGEGTERPHLMELAERLGVADRVIFTGRVDHTELPAHYSLIDVFVVPRTSEATTELVTPLKPYEAMAMGRAVLVSGTRALREMIIEGETGISYRPDDVEDMVARLEELIDDPGRMRELGTNAREWVTEHRSWDRNVEMYREVYAGLGLEIGAGASGSMSA